MSYIIYIMSTSGYILYENESMYVYICIGYICVYVYIIYMEKTFYRKKHGQIIQKHRTIVVYMNIHRGGFLNIHFTYFSVLNHMQNEISENENLNFKIEL